MAKMKYGSRVSLDGMMFVLNIIEVLHVCVLVQRTRNDLYCMGIGDLNLHTMGLPSGYYDAWPAGPCISLDTQPINNNLHNHLNVRSFLFMLL
jgi:hypothetical protein